MGIKENLDRVLEEIAAAARISGRDAESVKLLAVSKFHPQEAVREALSCGQFLFGENRVQEAELKFSGLNGEFPRLRLHLIGTLQRNKVKRILPLVSCIQSLDRLELLLEIEKRAAECGKEISVLFELHTGEESKSGYADLSSLFASIDALEFCPHVRCRGLMTMAPFTEDESAVRASFQKLRAAQEECGKRWPALDFSELSMGMSSDFRIAIEEGSTMVRIGTAVFGARA
ncbi:MAG: YggS family pyridoxal phosphate-dependent enzyme [Spirochaetes bacterium]|uniref:Pyridoxal phosphate homeostasis protein n=1 Tax=Candidatus Avitreponema avistercoris TaxID=2840705 RepID=A0A9D9EQ83_9SPIR|nr:YggS family pyridoxal phosphate-dependent enzyme [Candidatus Avitreponema avistercoris]